MDRQEAKFILQAYRPGGQDGDDPHFREALEMARIDPELRQWFAEQQALDAAIGQKLNSVPVPGELQHTILAGTKVATPTRTWVKKAWIAAAAVLAISAAGMHLWKEIGWQLNLGGGPRYAINYIIPEGCTAPISAESAPVFTRYCIDMVYVLEHLNQFDLASKDPEEIRRWLGESKGHPDFELPGSLAKQTPIGCRILAWKGKRVTLIAFEPGPEPFNQKTQLLVINRSDVPDGPPASTPVFLQYEWVATASWSSRDKTYILVSGGKWEYLNQHFAKSSL